MAQTASVTTAKVVEFLTSMDSGLGPLVANLSETSGRSLAGIDSDAFFQQNVAASVIEKSVAVKYPVVHVFADRVQNLLTEKFRTFSGKIRTIVEVRMSQDRIEELENAVRLYVDAVTQVLDANRGSWGQGMFFAGGYEIKFEPIQRGGLNFLQIARVTFDVDLSI
jgi:hypothetical protein